jgi:hypothetical protein
MSSCIAYGPKEWITAHDGHRSPSRRQLKMNEWNLTRSFLYTESQGTLSPIPVTIAPYVRSKISEPGYTDTLYSFVSMARLLILSRPFSRYLSVFAHKTIGRRDCFVMKFKEMCSRQSGTRASAHLPSLRRKGGRELRPLKRTYRSPFPALTSEIVRNRMAKANYPGKVGHCGKEFDADSSGC